jgi:hypothetical protein
MASVTLTGGYPKGTKAEARLRASDSFVPGAAAAAKASADEKGQITLKGLDNGVLYYVTVEGVAGVRTVQAKGPEFDEDANLHRTGPEATIRRWQADREAQAAARIKAEKTDPLVASPAPGRNVVDNRPDKRSPSVGEPQPAPKQQEISGPQRSDTPDGTATPKDPEEAVPDVRQEDIGKNVPQRSSTETGVATVKDVGEMLPEAHQRDVPAGTPQRSSTPEGRAEPKPKVRGGEVAKRDAGSANRARGRTKAKSEEVVKPKATTKQTTKTGTPKRPSSKRKK